MRATQSGMGAAAGVCLRYWRWLCSGGAVHVRSVLGAMAKRPPPQLPEGVAAMAKRPPPQLQLHALKECSRCHATAWTVYPQVCGPCKEMMAITLELGRPDVTDAERAAAHTVLKGLRQLLELRAVRAAATQRSVVTSASSFAAGTTAGACSPAAAVTEPAPVTPPEILRGQGAAP